MKRHIRAGSINHIADAMRGLLIGLMFLFLSCNGQKKSAMNIGGTKDYQTDNVLSLIVSDTYSGSDEDETLIITDKGSLQKFYSKINRTRKPGLPVPKIDFSKEMVIIQCYGKQKGAFIPELYVAENSEEEMVLGIKKKNRNLESSVITSPFSVYKMPFTEKEVVIRE